MAAETFISQRTNLKSVIAAYPNVIALPDAENLMQNYDMCRVIPSRDKESAVKFGVLEHLMRPSTPNELVETMFSFMSRPLALKLCDIVDRKEETGELAIREMEVIVTLEDLTESEDMPALQIWYTASNASITKYQSEPDLQGTWPVINLFDSPDLLCLLYSNEITFLDAYDPKTGAHKPSFLTPFLIDSIVPALYFEQSRRSFCTQTKPPKPQLTEQQVIKVPTRPLTMVRPLVLTPSPDSSLLEGSQVAPLFTYNSEESPRKVKSPEPVQSPHFTTSPEPQHSSIVVSEEVKEIRVIEKVQDSLSIPEIKVAEPQRAVEVIEPNAEEKHRPKSVPKPVPKPVPNPRTAKSPEEPRVTTRKLIIHRSRASKRTRCGDDNDVMETMHGSNWEWVQLDKQAMKLNREREGCGNECSLF